jgi:hypothetical protein
MTSEYEYFKLYEMYPSKTKFIDICYIPTFLITMTELEGILRQLCPGLLSMVELPGGTPASAKRE